MDMITNMSNTPIPTPYTPVVQNNQLIGSPNLAPGANDPGDYALQFVSQSGTTVLGYPLDIPKYQLTFTISAYKRTDLNSVGTFVNANYPGIIMPLPSQLIDTNHVNWQEVEVGTLAGTTVSAIAEGINGNIGAAVGGLAAAGLGLLAAGNAAAGSGGVAGFAGGLAQGTEAMLGISPNQFITLLMKGPTYKRHRFSWTLAPHNFAEANVLREIIRTFKNAMSPNYYSITANGAPILWAFPKIFHLRLFPNSLFMYKFKPCVCDYFVANYTPGNRAAFFRDTTGQGGQNGNNPPASIQIQANFIELEYWTEGNFSADNDPDDNYNNNGGAGNLADLLSQALQTITNIGANAPKDTGPD